MAKLKVGVFGLAGSIVTAVIAQTYSVCPDLAGQWPAILSAGVMAGLGLWLNKPR